MPAHFIKTNSSSKLNREAKFLRVEFVSCIAEFKIEEGDPYVTEVYTSSGDVGYLPGRASYVRKQMAKLLDIRASDAEEDAEDEE